MRLHPDDTLAGKYRIVRTLGRGGVGTVYEAENTEIRRRVAIKVLHTAGRTASTNERFRREAQAAALVGSDRIVEVLDFGQLPEGDAYLVMEYLEGESLGDRIQIHGGKLPPDLLIPIVVDLLDGLKDAHGAGVIHRDLKPDNIFLCRPRHGHGDYVKILDFGISKFELPGTGQTMTGVMMGTPYFMAPEQGRSAKDVDHRADIYSVGAILFRGLTGRHVHLATMLGDLLQQLLTTPAPRLKEVEPVLDAELSEIVARSLKREPRHRHPNAEALQRELLEWLDRHGLALSAGSRDTARLSARSSSTKTRKRLPAATVPIPEAFSFPSPTIAEVPPPSDTLPTHELLPSITQTIDRPSAPRALIVVVGSVFVALAVLTVVFSLSGDETTTTEEPSDDPTPAPRPTEAPSTVVTVTSSAPPTPAPRPTAERAAPAPTASFTAPPLPLPPRPPSKAKRRTFRRRLR